MSDEVFTLAELKNRSECLQRIVDHIDEAYDADPDEYEHIKKILEGFDCWTPYTGGDLP